MQSKGTSVYEVLELVFEKIWKSCHLVAVVSKVEVQLFQTLSIVETNRNEMHLVTSQTLVQFSVHIIKLVRVIGVQPISTDGETQGMHPFREILSITIHCHGPVGVFHVFLPSLTPASCHF